jgi:hypothetical protein
MSIRPHRDAGRDGVTVITDTGAADVHYQVTTTRAYAELAAEGFIATVPGKGAYVLPLDAIR